MRLKHLFSVLCLALISTVTDGPAAEPAAALPPSSRIFDTAPVSEQNPIIARIKDCNIEIPLGEFRAYVAGEGMPPDKSGPLTTQEKRDALNKLIDEHLLLWSAYQAGSHQAPGYLDSVENTRRMLLQEILEAQETGKAQTPEESARLAAALRKQLFDKADIVVATEAYEDAKKASKKLRLPENYVAKAGEELPDNPLIDIPEQILNQPLARWNKVTVAIGDFLSAYAQKPPAERPNIATQEGAIQILRELLEPVMMIAEAEARGLDRSETMRDKLELNRSALLRFHVQDQITAEAVKRNEAPGQAARVRQWYGAQAKTRYTFKEADGKEKVLKFDEEKERIENDYFEHVMLQVRAEKLRTLREGKEIVIDEKRLAETVAAAPAAQTGETELHATVAKWDADTREFDLGSSPAPTAEFSFPFENVSTEPLIVLETKPSCQCTTVKTPSLPWTLAPGEKGDLHATVKLEDKTESTLRTITVRTNQGEKVLTMKFNASKKN